MSCNKKSEQVFRHTSVSEFFFTFGLEHFFKLLICKFSADCKSFLQEKMQFDMETMKEFQIGNSVDPNQISDGGRGTKTSSHT